MLITDADADGRACWVTLVPEGGSEAVASVAAGAFHSLIVGAAGIVALLASPAVKKLTGGVS